jgi:hypothetical protein
MIGAIGVFCGAIALDRGIFAASDRMVILPTGLFEQITLLTIAASVATFLLLIRRRWRLGAADIPARLFFVGLFSAARWVDRLMRRAPGRTT